MRAFLIFLTLSIYLNSSGQDYIDYQKIFNRIDEDLLEEKYESAIERLDSIYENYDFIFGRHCFKALQICCESGDSIRANKWLEKCFVQGIPMWMIRANEITKNVFCYSSTANTIEQYDSLKTSYERAINLELRETVDSLFEIDQQYTSKVNEGFLLFRHTYHGLRWLNNNKRQYEILRGLIEKYGFPGEKLIGLPKHIEDSARMYNDFKFYGPILRETKAYIMLIHYYSSPRSDISPMLLENIAPGNLPPYQYGAINDFIARWGKKKHGDYHYYNIWFTDTDKANYEEIDERRKQIGLNNYKQQTRNRLIWKERRKNQRANSEIILE